MSNIRFTYFQHLDRSDEQLVEDALKRAYPPVKPGEPRFEALLERLRNVERKRGSDPKG